MVTPDIHWQPHPGAQTKCLQYSRYIRELNFGGARFGGKTDVGQAWLVDPLYLQHRYYRALVVRRNAEDLKQWEDRARRMYLPLQADFHGKPLVVDFPSGAKIVCGHLKDREAYTKYQGHEYQRILVEELGLIARLNDYLQLISACRSTIPQLAAQVMVNCNPGGIGHAWIKERWGIGREGKHKPCVAYPIPGDGRLMMYVPATIDDNPSAAADPNYAKFLESLPEPLRSAWRFGDWDIFSGQVFPLLDGLHIIDGPEIPASTDILFTYDWGSGHPFSVGYWWQDGDGRLYRCAELYGCGTDPDTGLHLTDDEVAERIVEFEQQMGFAGSVGRRLAGSDCFTQRVSASHGVGASTAETFAKHRLFLELGDCGPGSRKRKLDALKHRLRVFRDSESRPTALPMLVVYRSCGAFIRTIPSLVYDTDNIEDVD
ncbi:MAG: hypothetical protein NTY53_16775, partial [Kiritimatiellaeota bacterium]|nr:hypothetical protein [Kiritimatiellota bacterium]